MRVYVGIPFLRKLPYIPPTTPLKGNHAKTIDPKWSSLSNPKLSQVCLALFGLLGPAAGTEMGKTY